MKKLFVALWIITLLTSCMQDTSPVTEEKNQNTVDTYSDEQLPAGSDTLSPNQE